MVRSVAAALLLLAAVPVLADPPASDAKPKMKKVCHADPNGGGNPLWPQMKCHKEPIETAAAPAATQVALDTPKPH